MNGEILAGKCFYCGKYTNLKRQYFRFKIQCECHSPEHFELVDMCYGCTPKCPSFTSVELKNEVIENGYFKHENGDVVYLKDFNVNKSKIKYPGTTSIWIPTEYILLDSKWELITG